MVFFFLVQGAGGSPTGPDPENRVGDQDTGSPGRPVSSGLQVTGEPGHCRARTSPQFSQGNLLSPEEDDKHIFSKRSQVQTVR